MHLKISKSKRTVYTQEEKHLSKLLLLNSTFSANIFFSIVCHMLGVCFDLLYLNVCCCFFPDRTPISDTYTPLLFGNLLLGVRKCTQPSASVHAVWGHANEHHA